MKRELTSRCSSRRVLVRLRSAVVVLADAFILVGCATRVPRLRADVLLSGVHVIDLSKESVIRSQVVLINGNAITHVIPHGSQQVEAARVVTFWEGFVIPGLWDMHAHVRSYEPEDVLPMFVAEGVTGIRDLGLTSFSSIQQSRAA